MNCVLIAPAGKSGSRKDKQLSKQASKLQQRQATLDKLQAQKAAVAAAEAGGGGAGPDGIPGTADDVSGAPGAGAGGRPLGTSSAGEFEHPLTILGE